ncbi:hypothetical protein ACM55M_09795 [Flavobacterium sp. ZT3R25]|uniref:hypothetical protein n=1 Tax=Flavobacterium galactosi TaxID=3398735 RepID=UPI003A86A54B
MSFLFALDSCTTDTPFVSDNTLGKVEPKTEINYYNLRKEDAVAASIEEPFVSAERVNNELFESHYVPESFSTYSTKTEGDDIIDPDWKKLITRFMEGNRGAK